VLLYARSLRHVDHAVRDARVLARRAHTMLRRGDRAGVVLAPVLEQLASAVRVFADDLAERDRFDEVRDTLLEVANRATTALESERSLGVTVVVAQIRSVAADLMYATGLSAVELDEMLGLGSEDSGETRPPTESAVRPALEPGTQRSARPRVRCSGLPVLARWDRVKAPRHIVSTPIRRTPWPSTPFPICPTTTAHWSRTSPARSWSCTTTSTTPRT
jgi:hypothetical protein